MPKQLNYDRFPTTCIDMQKHAVVFIKAVKTQLLLDQLANEGRVGYLLYSLHW